MNRVMTYIAMTLLAAVTGCAQVVIPNPPEFFDPTRILNEECGFTGSKLDRLLILPEDAHTRPDFLLIVTQYLEIINSGDSESAISFINEAIGGMERTSDRDVADLQLVYASALYWKNPSEAVRVCDQLVQKDSMNWRAFHLRSLLHKRLDHTQESLDDMRRAEALRSGKTIRNVSATGGVI